MIGCRHGFTEVIEYLLIHGKALINEIDNGGRTALMIATLSQKEKIISILLDRLANVNQQDKWGYNALTFAASIPNKTLKMEIIEKLISYKIDCNALDKCSNIPLHKAAKNWNIDLCTYLLKNGANPTIRNIDGQLPIDFFPEEEVDLRNLYNIAVNSYFGVK
jgi:ankyrin repeat protein